MAEEVVNIKEEKEEDGVLSVGGESVLNVKERPDEIKPTENTKETEENKPEEDEEKKEGIVENRPDEDTAKKGSRWNFVPIKEQDISQYLWDTLLNCINKFNEYIYNKTMDALDRGLSKSERGPAAPEAPKEEKIKHTKERGTKLYDLRSAVTDNFATSINDGKFDDFLSKNSVVLKNSAEPEKDRIAFKNLIVHAQGVAYDMAVSELLHEKMSKDKNFDFATMDTKALIDEVKTRVPEKFEHLRTGIIATSYYAENIGGMIPSQALKACEEYLTIRENESIVIKNLINKDLDAGNFIANDKKPSRDTGVKINAYNRSFNNDAVVINSTLKETITFLENSNLTEDEKVNLAEFQKKINLSQNFEAATVLDLQKQIKAIDAAYKANKNNPLRAKIAALKKANGLNPVSLKIAQQHSNNTIIQAVNKAKGGRK